MFPYQLVIFDLDGTLVDSASDIAEALNLALHEVGLPQVTESTVRGWIGEGMHPLLATALREAGSTQPADALMAAMMRHYSQCLLHRSRLYAGVVETLAALRTRGIWLAVCTNKPARFVAPLLAHLGVAAYVDAALGGDVLGACKPDPLPLLHLAAQFGLSPGDCLMVGDSATDAAAAQAANMPLAMVSYGYLRGFDPMTSGAVAVIEDLRELLAMR